MRRSPLLLTLALIPLLACSPAQGGDAVASPEAALPGGLGRVSLPNSGSPEAQAPFLAGLAALHSFHYEEAADLFRQAQEIDADFALAYWGEALTYEHALWNENSVSSSRAALERLAPSPEERAAKTGGERERAYLASAEALFSEGSREQRHRAYSAALRELYESNPDDLESASLYALSLQALQKRADMDMRAQMESAAILEEVFAANPLHPGAAHYLIHAYDDPIHAPLGLRPARVYAKIAPAAHHALHMPSHIFLQLGMWDEAAASNEAAYAASVDWVEKRDHPKDKQDFHSFSWLHYIYLQQGRYAAAHETLQTAEKVLEDAPSIAYAVWGMRAREVIEAAGFSPGGLLAFAGSSPAPPPESCRSLEDYSGSGSNVLFARGWCALAQGDRKKAREISERLSTSSGGSDSRWAQGDAIAARELEGLIELAAGKTRAGLELLAEAVEMEREVGPPSGPPHPAKPAHELYAEALLAQGRAEESREQFADSLGRMPGRAASLLGAARAASAAGEAQLSGAHYRELLSIWDAADTTVPALSEAQSHAAPPGSGEPAP